jgi:hypothetical protein
LITYEYEARKHHREDIERVSEFTYVGMIVSEDYDDTAVSEANLKKARVKWDVYKKLLTPIDAETGESIDLAHRCWRRQGFSKSKSTSKHAETQCSTL